MNFSFIPSLEHMALVKIVTTLWNQYDIRSLLVKSDLNSAEIQYNRYKQWQTIEDKVIEKVPLLHESGLLKEKILGAVKPIGVEILNWVDYNQRKFHFAINLKNEIHWTSQGIIDRRKTAEALVRDETIDIEERFKVACFYYLEDAIEPLLKNMPAKRNSHQPILFWTNDDYENAFCSAVRSGNEAAVKYFWNKLTPEEREESINLAGLECCGDVHVFQFIIPHLNEEQLLELYDENAFWIILVFMDWPWQNFFVEMANRLWDYLPVRDYCSLLEGIVYKVLDGYKDYCYRELFKQFWVQSPRTHKDYVINHCAETGLLSKLFESKDEKTISLILKEATAEEKENILFHSKSIRISICLAGSDEWNLLKFFISECISSAEKIEKFKDKCEEDDAWSDFSRETCVRESFFQFLNDLMQNFDKKRGCEEGDSALTKRLRRSSNE